MSLILPKGIVINSPGINDSVKRMNLEPLDLADIARFWKVYTTTKRRLLDPTAERLENYWWRIWGSRARELRGATVARLFADISDGKTFVQLRGPTNRDEGTSTTQSKIAPEPAKPTANVLPTPQQNRAEKQNSAPAPARAIIPTMSPHPILKKSRGPSNNGPRPTARFISPYESEEDADQSTHSAKNSDAADTHGNGVDGQAGQLRTKDLGRNVVVQQLER